MSTCDCGQRLSDHDDEHAGLCCDCFDISLGLWDDLGEPGE